VREFARATKTQNDHLYSQKHLMKCSKIVTFS
jgi:hypothetical protein